MDCVASGSVAAMERPDRTARGYGRFRCRSCGKQFNERSGTLLNHAQYPSDVIALVVLWRWLSGRGNATPNSRSGRQTVLRDRSSGAYLSQEERGRSLAFGGHRAKLLTATLPAGLLDLHLVPANRLLHGLDLLRTL